MMLDFYLATENIPFASAFAVVLLLGLLEVIMLMFGGSLAGLDGDSDADFALEADAGLDADADFDAGFDGDTGLEGDGGGDMADGAGSGVLSWIGLGKVPLYVFIIALATSFSLAGYTVQGIASAVYGLIPAWMAAGIALVPTVVSTGVLTSVIARIMPKTETSVVSIRSFLGARAKVTMGVARADLPAEARLVDHTGQSHYVTVVPVEGTTEIPAGADVVLMKRSGSHFIAAPVDHEKIAGL